MNLPFIFYYALYVIEKMKYRLRDLGRKLVNVCDAAEDQEIKQNNSLHKTGDRRCEIKVFR